ncbi:MULTISPECIES: TIGR03621 family F420-dependent LLM class oxidoreductase [Mycobacteriaceae]|uniref:TIGR03621 family F420-dependent LLM class oxidoreductase n=1 Tax=Mycobacteriaceae TaxID=1762 RepID=UPI000801B0BB|nr:MULTISPECIES: TIGR03621 family F420-dependent LLM class oxidoreductase [Mycobacteriaceae]MCK0175097.1 TIGR03621 family F420-dependent LLM class oxidoreductase [Mycolicibacterium sp. F2034L]OBB61279.1 F420-dependent oxidoreductase [Mycobacterium sp. 852013-51886_SCH5428379]
MASHSIADDSHRGRRPRFGLTTALARNGAQTRQFARAVEAAGFDVLTFADHLMPAVAPFVGATAAAVATERLRVGTLVLNNDFRHPVETAREAAGVAMVSDGRFELGLGAGHMKSEYDAAGLPFAEGAVRVSRLEESAGIVRALLDGVAVDTAGAHYRVHADAGALLPLPAQRVPMLIGGNGERVLRLVGRLADIAGFAGITHNHDATKVRLTHFGPEGLQNRIAVVRDAAGDRFDQIELNALIQAVVVTDDRAAAAAELAAAFGGVSAEDLLASPFVLLGSHAQMADALTERQRRFGVSYWTVFDEWGGRASAMSDMAEVIALLHDQARGWA